MGLHWLSTLGFTKRKNKLIDTHRLKFETDFENSHAKPELNLNL